MQDFTPDEYITVVGMWESFKIERLKKGYPEFDKIEEWLEAGKFYRQCLEIKNNPKIKNVS